MPLDPALTEFTTTSPIAASFDFFDLATNIAFKNFFASVNSTNALSPHQQDSNTLLTDRSTTGTTEINFDYQFNLGMIVSGDFTIAYTQRCNSGTAASTVRVDWRIIHVDADSNETELVGTVTGDSLAKSNDNKTERVVVSGSIPRTNFQIGEKIRLETSLVFSVGANGGGCSIYHDPTSRSDPLPDDNTGLDPTTDLTFTIPFEVQP